MYTIDSAIRNKIYTGGLKYEPYLYIGAYRIPNQYIEYINIDDPSIDKTSQVFYLGSFISKQLEVQLRNPEATGTYIDFTQQISYSIKITDESTSTEVTVPIGVFNIETLPADYYKTRKIVALDNAVKFKPAVNIHNFFNTTTDDISAEELLQALCDYFGVTLESYPNTNKTIRTGSFDSTKSGKIYISYIAEIMGGIAKCTRTGGLAIVPLKSDSVAEIDHLTSKSYKIGEEYVITDVVYDNGQMVHSATTNILPEGYTRVDYLKSSGSQYINLGIYGQLNTKIVIKATKDNTTTAQALFGDIKTTSKAISFNSSVTSRFGNNSGSFNLLNYVEVGEPFIAVQDKNGIKINGETVVSFNTVTSFTTTQTLYLFTRNGSSISGNWNGKVYYCKIYNGTTLARDLIPCYRNVDNTLGMYDLVHDQFFSNIGSGQFSYGSKVPVNKNTLYIRSDNIFVTGSDEERDTIIQNIFNSVEQLSLYSITTENYADFTLDSTDTVTYRQGTTARKYNTLYSNSFKFKGSIMGKVDTQIPTKIVETNTNVIVPDQKAEMRSIKTTINQVENTLTTEIARTTDLSGTVSQNYQDIINQLNNYASIDDLSNLETRITSVESDTYTKTQLDAIISGTDADGKTVSYMKSGSMTFDINGITVDDSESKVKSTHSAQGLEVIDKTDNTSLLYVGFDDTTQETVVKTKNIKVEKYFEMGANSRFEDYTDDNGNIGTGCFWIGG